MRTAVSIEQLLQDVFDGASDDTELAPEEYARRRAEFVFHLRDCKRDFEEMARLFQHPEQHDEEEASRLVIGMLYHVIPHLNRAGRLLLDEIADPFTADPTVVQ